MSRKLIFTVLILLTMSGIVWAMQSVTTSNHSASGVISSTACYFVQATLMPNGSDNCDITLYNGTDTSGVKIRPTITALGTGGKLEIETTFPIFCDKGLYVALGDSGSNVDYNVDRIDP